MKKRAAQPKKTVEPAVNKAGGKELEEFCEYVSREFKPEPDKPVMSLEDLANALRAKFRLTIPVGPQVTTLLKRLDIELCHKERQGLTVDGLYTYNHQSGRWEIHVVSGQGVLENRAVFHELFEILYWRCYHRIRWWSTWAEFQEIADPDTVADRFAYYMVLPSKTFRNRVKKHGFDIWKLSSVCEALPVICFYAISRYTTLPFPYFHAILDFAARPICSGFAFEDLIDAKVVRRAYKQPRANELSPDWINVKELHRSSWLAVKSIQSFASKGTFVKMRYDDVAHQSRFVDGAHQAEANCLAGFRLSAPIDIIARHNPSRTSQVYVQALPAGYAPLFLSGATDLLAYGAIDPGGIEDVL